MKRGPLLLALLLGALVAALPLLAPAVHAAGSDVRLVRPLGEWYREGRPLVVRAVNVLRLRAAGSPWVLPRGARGDEFVLRGVAPDGARLRVLLDLADGGSEERVLELRPLPAAGHVTAVLDGSAPGEHEVAVRADGLPTVPEAWRTFDAVRGVPDGLPAAELLALSGLADAASGAPFDPWMAPDGPHPFRAASEAARRAPYLPPDVPRALLLLASTLLAVIALLHFRRDRAPLRVAWLALPALAACGWLLAAERLPGALHATALVIERSGTEAGGPARIVLVHVAARRAGSARLTPPQGAEAPVLLRWSPGDGSTRGVELGADVRLELAAGESRLLAYALPASATTAAPLQALDAAGGAAAPPELVAWLRRTSGLSARVALEVSRDALPQSRGMRVVLSGSYVAAGTRK